MSEMAASNAHENSSEWERMKGKLGREPRYRKNSLENQPSSDYKARGRVVQIQTTSTRSLSLEAEATRAPFHDLGEGAFLPPDVLSL